MQNVRECTKMRTSRSRMEKNSGEGRTGHPLPITLGAAIFVDLALDLPPPTQILDLPLQTGNQY